MKKCLHMGFATLVSILMLIASATAHMALSKSMPEPDSVVSESPRSLQVWFTQAPDPVVSQMVLSGSQGEVELGEMMLHDDKSIMVMVESTLAAGKYLVNWRTAGDDGHIQRGEYSFTVNTSN